MSEEKEGNEKQKVSFLVQACSIVSDSCNPVDYSLPGSLVHGIFHARVLEWGAIALTKQAMFKSYPLAGTY